MNQQQLDMPEVLWKAYIDFEIEQEEFDRTRSLYNRLLTRTQHVKVRLLVKDMNLCLLIYFYCLSMLTNVQQIMSNFLASRLLYLK